MTQWNIHPVIQGLQQARHQWRQRQHRSIEIGGREFPSKQALKLILEDLCGILFPMRLGPSELRQESEDDYIAYTLERVLNELHSQVVLALHQGVQDQGLDPQRLDPEAICTHRPSAEHVVQNFANQLPHIRRLIDLDVYAAYEGDPSAHSVDEILLCYPGVMAIMYHRLAHQLYQDVPFIARMISESAHSSTGIDIHPGAQIGAGFFIDHGTGVVIGETCIIGQHVRLYQAVTLGAKRFELTEEGALKKNYPRHPIVEDDVVIYAGATILGRICIGKGSVIGGNVWLTHSVPAGSHILQSPSAAHVPPIQAPTV
ncbi:serine O-acetyltransferase [Acinetobacter calcoaceticus]|uniref:Serine O-acetyltransferase n=1 Tax=Acinetobacter calcoaceticus TaxID=471 RepID=A0A4R1XLF8_ACICA|nr:serine O-acetyltransferase [Acinetobacter calcoaceticus]